MAGRFSIRLHPGGGGRGIHITDRPYTSLGKKEHGTAERLQIDKCLQPISEAVPQRKDFSHDESLWHSFFLI
jgi:hypothetical protein